MNLDFYWGTLMVGSVFVATSMNPWPLPTLCQKSKNVFLVHFEPVNANQPTVNANQLTDQSTNESINHLIKQPGI